MQEITILRSFPFNKNEITIFIFLTFNMKIMKVDNF